MIPRIVAVWIAVGFGLVPALIIGGLVWTVFSWEVAATVATMVFLAFTKKMLFGKKQNG